MTFGPYRPALMGRDEEPHGFDLFQSVPQVLDHIEKSVGQRLVLLGYHQ